MLFSNSLALCGSRLSCKSWNPGSASHPITVGDMVCFKESSPRWNYGVDITNGVIVLTWSSPLWEGGGGFLSSSADAVACRWMEMEISSMDLIMEEGVIAYEGVVSRVKFIIDLWSLLRIKYYHIFQRSKSKWLKEGNDNTTFFYAYFKSGNKRISILDFCVGDIWVQGVP